MANQAERTAYVVALSLMLGPMSGCVNRSDTVCDIHACISESKLSSNIANALRGKVVGFISIVGNQSPIYEGLARSARNPPITEMSPSLVTDIASVSKTLTAIGVLRSLARHKLTIDDLIAPFIYSDWVQGPNIGTITFRELLTHRAGIRADCNGNNTTYAVLKTMISSGVRLEDKAVASYNNCNYAIFRELLPIIEGQSLNGLSDVERANASAMFYVGYINRQVLNPLGIPADDQRFAQCMPPRSGTPDILSYPFPAGSNSGTDWGDWTLACGGGGWVLSANDLSKIVSDLATGKVLLGDDEKKEMFSNCLGWDCSVRPDCPSPYVCKNGTLTNGNVSLWAYIGILNCNVPVIVIVNSPIPSTYQDGSDIIGLVEDAYEDAKVSRSPRPCRSP